MSTLHKPKALNVLRIRNIRRLIILRAYRHQRSLLTYKRINGPSSSFSESVATYEPSYRRWCDSHSDKIPRGYLPVYVGPDEKRYIIPMVYLSMPDFVSLMEIAAEEFGFQQEGGLKIPCDKEDFEEILFKCLAIHKATSKTRKRKWT